jgi:hypothetical protein
MIYSGKPSLTAMSSLQMTEILQTDMCAVRGATNDRLHEVIWLTIIVCEL